MIVLRAQSNGIVTLTAGGGTCSKFGPASGGCLHSLQEAIAGATVLALEVWVHLLIPWGEIEFAAAREREVRHRVHDSR